MSMADGRKEEGMSDIGRIWRPFWGSAGGSWVDLGRLGAVPEHLRGPWGVLGSFLDRLGVVLGASWDVLWLFGRIFFGLGCVFERTFIVFLIDAGLMFEPFVVESALWGLPKGFRKFPRCASTASRE